MGGAARGHNLSCREPSFRVNRLQNMALRDMIKKNFLNGHAGG